MTLLRKAKEFVAANIGPSFHEKRLDSLQALKLKQILKRKNPYLFRAKAVATAADLIKQLLDAHLSSNEETVFGDFLESLAIFICSQSYKGFKSTTEGLDLEFSRDSQRYVVSIKSGPNWGNSRQIAKMIDDFNRARKIAGTRANLIAVNGCCYGQDANPHKEKGNYLKLCGQSFWELISGDEEIYKEIVEPLGYQAKQKNDVFYEAYAAVINRFTLDFSSEFCDVDGKINWGRLIEFNSARKTAKDKK
jgi:Type II restriction endonuclease EcoO109I